MSQYPITQYVKITDTRLEAISSNKVVYVVEEGASVASYNPLQSSSHSVQNTSFNLNNISDFTCRDSRMCITMQMNLALTCFNADLVNSATIINSSNFGFKQYPVNRAVSSIQHQINQASITLNTNDILDAITRVNLHPDASDFYENTQPDLIDSYANANGSNFNPLNPYSTTLAGDGVYKPRTTGWRISGGSNVVAPNSNGTVNITCDFYEPLITPFNNVSKKERQGLYAITGELLNINWVSDLFNNVFAFNPYLVTIVSSVVTFTNSAQLNLIYLTPKENTIVEIPRESAYPYNQYSIFSNTITQGVPVMPHTPLVNVNSQIVSFTNLPAKVLVYARLSNGARTCETPDKYLSISNINLTFDNGAPQLNGANNNQLYDISVRNGLVMPRQCFRGDSLSESILSQPKLFGCGSVLVLDPCLDFGIKAGDSIGTGGRYIFQVNNAQFLNNTDTAFPQITLYVIGVTNALLKRVGSMYTNDLLTTPPGIVDLARALPSVSHSDYMEAKHSNAFLGSGIGDWFKKTYDMGTRAYDWANKNKDNLTKAYNVGKSLLGGINVGGINVGGEIDMGNSKSRLFGNMVRPVKNKNFYQ